MLAKPLANGDVSVVLFNKGDTAQTSPPTAATIGLPSRGAPFQLTDLVSKAASAGDGTISASLAPHSTVIYRVHPGGDKHLPIHTAATISSATARRRGTREGERFVQPTTATSTRSSPLSR